MPVPALPHRFDTALFLRQRDLAPEEYAVYLIDLIGAALSQRWPASKRRQQDRPLHLPL